MPEPKNLSLLALDDVYIGSARGRKGKDFCAVVKRELNEGDLAAIANPPDYASASSPLKKMRHTHHLLARLLAEGRPPGECGLITGYSGSRISVLQNDPAFKELVAYYKAQASQAYLNVHERVAALGLAALDEIQERLEEKPEDFSIPMLHKMAVDLMDRTVTKPNEPPKPTAGVNLQVTFVASPASQNDAIAGAKPGIVIEGDPA